VRFILLRQYSAITHDDIGAIVYGLDHCTAVFWVINQRDRMLSLSSAHCLAITKPYQFHCTVMFTDFCWKTFPRKVTFTDWMFYPERRFPEWRSHRMDVSWKDVNIYNTMQYKHKYWEKKKTFLLNTSLVANSRKYVSPEKFGLFSMFYVVCLCVCLLVTCLSHAKSAKPIKMPFRADSCGSKEPCIW